MSIYSQAESGTKLYTSRYTKSISNTMRYDCRFHDLIPVLKRFVLPGDVWRIGGDALVRFHPMRTPSMTPYSMRVRYFFIPLRLIEENTELIITGSHDGKLYTLTLPEFKNFVADADKNAFANAFKVSKYTFWDYMNVQPLDYEAIKTDECLPAQYWYKGYLRVFFDYYRDENYDSYDDFNSFFNALKKTGADAPVNASRLAKNYFTSALPWQLKATSAPRIDVTGNATFTPNYNEEWITDGWSSNNVGPNLHVTASSLPSADKPFSLEDVHTDEKNFFNYYMNEKLNQPQSVQISQLGFTADDLRTMMAQTRIFERLARCGSRYTEYLRSNFGTAPADDTLQRAQYLGGWKIPIVTSEVLQTAADGSTPVGTMRGHGISRGGNTINTFYAKEFGLLFGLAEIRPNIEFTTGIPRQLTYKKRFDFFNPSFQHLSEQEVRNGELFVSNTDGQNDATLGYQAYGNELRSSQDEVVADMRDSLSDWGSSLHFTSRPNVQGLLRANNHYGSFNAPFVVQSTDTRPVIVTFRNNLDVYRPMVKFATPGLVDHL